MQYIGIVKQELYSGTSILDTIGTQVAVLYREVPLIQR